MIKFVPGRPLYPVLWLLAGTAMAVGLLWFLWTLILWYRLHPHLPWRDTFLIIDDLLPLLQSGWAPEHWTALFEPHYGAHRITVPRLLVALDLAVFGGQNHTLYTSAWLGMACCLGIFTAMCRNYFGNNRAPWLFCLGIVLTVIFAPAHLWNVINAINASWHITFACAFGAFFILINNENAPSHAAWIAAYALASIAAFTTFAGVIVWLLLPVMAIGGSRKSLTLTVCTSALLTIGYTIGLTSDAEVAIAWDSQNADVAQQMKAAGLEAMARNTPLAIVHKAMNVLTWPLSSSQPGTAIVLVAFSIIILAFHWIVFLRYQLLGIGEYHAWLKLCLLISTLAVGVALAIQLGRVIEQPNHANGPSFERYNTVVAVYWMGITGLLMSRYSAASDRHRAILMSFVLVITIALISPTGTYLKEEISSIENAASLYVQGESPRLRGKLDKKLLRFRPEYVFTFDKFFREGQLAYRVPKPIPSPIDAGQQCEEANFRGITPPSIKPRLTKIQSTPGATAAVTRDIVVFSGEQFASRLVAKHHGNYSPLDLIQPRKNDWTGQISNKHLQNNNLSLYSNILGGIPVKCRIAPGTGKKLLGKFKRAKRDV